MAMSLNRVQLIGNLTRDPEMKQIPGGQVVTSFGVATNLTWTDKSGEKQNKVEFHNIVAWRKLAEICGQYLKKGSQVYIEGQLSTRKWRDEKSGIDKYSTEVVIQGYNSSLTMLGGRAVAENNNQNISSLPNDETSSSSSDLDDEIPPF